MIFRENYVKKIMALTGTPFVKVITGVRRSGKSTIMQMIIAELKKERCSRGQMIGIKTMHVADFLLPDEF